MTVDLDFFGPDAKLHHVGIAVRSIKEAVSGLEMIEDKIQGVTVGFVRLSGLTLELIEPASEKSPIDASLAKGTKLLHICIEVPSLKIALEHCTKHGFRKISKEEPAAAFNMRKIVYVFSTIFGLVELVESGHA